jgi:lauroyl/myristoyl acyltransferase
MKNSFKNACGLLFFFLIRGLERALPVRGLYLLLKPYAFTRAWLNNVFKSPLAMPLPDFFNVARTRRAARQARMNGYLNRPLLFFPKRLAAAKWKNHCRIEGLAHWERAKQDRRPVVLAYFHWNNYFLLRTWPRALGIPVTSLEGGESKNRSWLKKLRDRMQLFPEIQVVFQLDQLRAAAEFLAAGNVLMVALDRAAGKQVSVPFCDGWNFQMATGAIRLAARHQAELIPACIIDEGGWRFRIELGRPVPAELLAAEDGWSRAGKYLLDEMRPHFQSHPEQCSKKMLERLERNPVV